MKRIFAIEQDKEVAELYRQGMSSIKLARQYGVDKSTILGALKRQGVRRRGGKEEPSQKDIIAGMKKFGNRLLTPSEIDQAYKIYSVGGFSLNAISQAYSFGKTGRGLSAAFKRQGYKVRGGKVLTKKQEDKAIELYKRGLSSTQVADKMKVSVHVVANTLNRRMDVDTRNHTSVYKYTVNEDMFSKIDNEKSAYLLGFIYADGAVYNKLLRIMISETDTAYLQKLKTLLGSNYPLYPTKRSGGYKTDSSAILLQVNSEKLTSDLRSCGIVPGRNQFHKAQAAIHSEVMRHFIRGYLDGDGCIRGAYNPSVTFVGQVDILEWIREVFHQELNTNPNLKIAKGKGIHTINYCGINQATLICQWLYKDATIWMQRKRDKFDSWPKPRNERRFRY